jgi:hypothetical protein
MKERLRRVILFTVIVITGSVMILFDVPLIFMIPLILAVGIIILVLLGAVTGADIRSVFTRKKLKNPKKKSLIKRLDEMKFFEKKPAQSSNRPASPDKKKEPAKSTAEKPDAGSHLKLFFTSLGSMRTVLRERSKQAKKVDHINELLDKTISEKVKISPLASAGKGANTKIPQLGDSGGQAQKEQEKDQDPFLSLSGDEFDVSLLDGLDEQEPSGTPSPGLASAPAPGTGSSLAINESGIRMPSLEISSQAEDILKDNEGGLEEFRGLEGGESIDQDFGDLDKVNLDELDLDVDLEEKTPSAADTPEAAKNPTTTVNADWIASDAPKGADLPGSEISTRDEMASFAGGASGSDADLLSSLASEVKHVAKEQNTSLLRDLKGFKAPASEIENELTDVYNRIKAGQDSGKKK